MCDLLFRVWLGNVQILAGKWSIIHVYLKDKYNYTIEKYIKRNLIN